MSWRPRWYLKSVDYIITATGVKIIAYTDVACHLTFRWTTTQPRIHLDPVLKRGVPFRSMPRYCFTTYHDNEQEEAHDTYIHTFIKEPWPACQTRWYYLFGTIDGVASPSESPLLKYHRVAAPAPVCFYPDPYPEITSVDGWCNHHEPPLAGVSWATLVARPGNGALHTSTFGQLFYFYCRSNIDLWEWLDRSIFTFDTSPIGAGKSLISGIFSVRGYSKADEASCIPFINLYTSSPANPNDIINTDFATLGTVPLCDTPISYDAFNTTGYNDFVLNAIGLAAINKTGITTLGLRNSNYDAARIAPPWVSRADVYMMGYFAEAGEDYRPKLCLVYQ